MLCFCPKSRLLFGGATEKIEEHFNEAIEIARTSGISLNKLVDLLKLLYEED